MLVKLMVIISIMIVVGVVVPHVLMHYEVHSGVPFVVALLMVGAAVMLTLNKENRRCEKEAVGRKHRETSSLFSDSD